VNAMTTHLSRLRLAGPRATSFLVLQVLLAAVLLNAGIGKYAGDTGPVETFDQVGVGQWFRYVIGTIEIISGAGLLIAPIAGLAALAAGSVLIGAVAMEVLVLDPGNPITPAILLALLALVAWHHRARTMTLLARAFSHIRPLRAKSSVSSLRADDMDASDDLDVVTRHWSRRS
jgi:putative oxidoreductase